MSDKFEDKAVGIIFVVAMIGFVACLIVGIIGTVGLVRWTIDIYEILTSNI